MRILKEHCIDVNSQYCPCILAEMNHCLMCSQLQGEGNCTCEWNGTCVLYEKHWNGDRARPQKRIEEVTSFSSVEMIGDETVIVSFDVSEELARMLKKQVLTDLQKALSMHRCCSVLEQWQYLELSKTV